MTEQEEFEFRQRLEQEQAAAAGAGSTAQADLVNPLYGTIGGAFLGQVAGPAINKGVEAVRSGAPGAAPGAASGAAPGQKFAAKTGYGSGTGYTVEEVVEHKKAQEKPIGKGKITSKIAGNSPMNVDRMLQLEAAKKAEDARRAAALAQGASSLPGPVQAAGRFIGGAAQSGVTPYVGRGVAGAGAGFQGVDAYNRLQQGDIPGAAISGLGALGSAAAFIPTPVTRVGGTAIGVGAELLNQYLDSLKKKVEGMNQPVAAPAPVQGPLSAPAPQGMAEGGEVKLPGKLGKIASLGQKAAHEFGNKNPGRMTDFLQNHLRKFVVPTQADRMGGVGGPSFSANSIALPEYKGKVWGSGNEGTATGITNLAKDERFGGPENQIFVPLLGHQNQHKSNQIVFNRLMQEFYKNPEKLTPEIREKINAFMRSGGGIDPKTGQTNFPIFADFDIANKDDVALLGTSFDNRGVIARHAFGGERIDGKKSQIFDYQKTLDELADPTVAGAPTFAVGPRAFKLTGEIHPEARPDLNAAFPNLLLGEDFGVTYKATPNGVLFQDFQNQWRQNKGKTQPLKSGKLPEPGYYENTLGYKVKKGDTERLYPRQEVTEQLLDSMYDAGYAVGGLVSLEKK
jgi:hypothetical protein